ncbi:MAG: hypothetical protein AAB464_00475 [Patescibacteria group bacterium]
MKKLFKNKQFVLFLILTVVVYSFAVQTAEASWFSDAWNDATDWIADTYNSVINIAADAIGANFTSDTFTLLTLSLFDPLVGIVIGGALVQCAVLGQNSVFVSGCGSGDTGAAIISATDLGCAYQIPITFYNVGMNTNYGYGTETYYDDYGKLQTRQSSQCSSQPIDETNRKIALYRYTLDGNGDLNNWFNNIKNDTGGGYEKINENLYWMYSGWVEENYPKFVETDYQTVCASSSVCKFIDTTVPENSYIAYVAKILGPYTGAQKATGDDGRDQCISRGPDKFLAKSPDYYPDFSYSGKQGIVGPYKTGFCPRPTVDLKINSSDGPLNLYLPNSGAVLNWESQYTSSCVVSGDWSGDKPISGSEDLGNLSRGTANPGGGKIYQFSITCDSSYGLGSVTDSVSATVFEYPVCSFSANPSVIELPNSSQLSQSCSYADSCSISQKVGTVCSGETDCATDSSNVRPTATTTFTLTCQGLDGSQSWQTTVGIGQPGDVKYEEVIPQ